ncbi:hypothetical protein NZL82_17910 [Sphingomonas sanguinis]|uniref:hypothetical protein n=1 Tax=Sphingomonas sp. LC-1 TaxID=3110957 RepID=UPI0021BA8E15|nr:hypothetical protein [Sphingomonas sp. LC-1]MCT8003751.1 hypothetical protein [Sphingomonas sp. LC-1]
MNGLRFDTETLAWFARRSDPSLALAGAWSSIDWQTGFGAIERLYDLKRSTHFLRHHRGLLPRLWERQITEALRAMLLEMPSMTLVRCQALLDSLRGPLAPRLHRIDGITADQADRIDLAIHFRTVDDVAGCLVIEAKLDSELSNTQLGKYLAGIRTRYARPEQRHLFVVAPTKTRKTASLLAKRENAEWSFLSWQPMLLRWQRALPDDMGLDALSLFSEIWKRVGGR